MEFETLTPYIETKKIVNNIIICPFSDDGCCGTLLQTGQIGIVECNECGAEFELMQHGIEDK